MITSHVIRGSARRFAGALVLVSAMCGTTLADVEVLDLDNDQIRRLGIEFNNPTRSSTLTVASAPAEIVIPPVQQSVVSTPVNGLVSSLLVAVGDTVEAGQPIAEILSAEYMDMQRRYLDATAADQLAAAQLGRDEGLFAEGIIADRRLQEPTGGRLRW